MSFDNNQSETIKMELVLALRRAGVTDPAVVATMEVIPRELFVPKVFRDRSYEDITLPRAEGIKCPNEQCQKAKPEIIYIKYDNENMKFIYICLDCYKEGIPNHIW